MTNVAQAEPAPEYAVKAAYIYNFAMFTEWPTDTLPEGAPIAICARADHPLRSALDSLAEKTVKGRRLLIRSWDRAAASRDCQVLVLDGSDRESWKAWKSQAGQTGVLSIGDDSAGLPGTVIQLAVEDGRLRFSVQSSAARQAGLVLSARLLGLAKAVQ